MPQGIVNKLTKQKLSGKQFGFQMVFPAKSLLTQGHAKWVELLLQKFHFLGSSCRSLRCPPYS